MTGAARAAPVYSHEAVLLRLCIVHFSDVHLRKTKNPVAERISALSQAILSSDAEFRDCILVLSGDIAMAGAADEYAEALHFLHTLQEHLLAGREGMNLHFVSVPGNHDCNLPLSEVGLREVLVKGMIPLITGPSPDQAIMEQLLQAQSAYREFEHKLGIGDGNQSACRISTIEIGQHKVRFNLINTAILSQRMEHQGTLYVSITQVDQLPSVSTDDSLSITVLHHSYVWLESNNAMQLRANIERVSDIVLTGHQHYPHNFYKLNSTGERLLYLEAGALQEENRPQQSTFNILLFEFESGKERSLSFKWINDMYKVKEDSDWRPLQLNRSIRYKFDVSATFERFLSNPGANYAHNHKSDIYLADIFVYPALRVVSIGEKSSISEVLGDAVFGFMAGSHRLVIQAPDRGGRTALAKTAFVDFLKKTQLIPLFLEGQKIKSAKENRVQGQLFAAFESEYSPAMLEHFKQLPHENRVLLVDDWHKTELNGQGQKAFLQYACSYFGHVILFADEFSEIHEITNPRESTLVRFDRAKIAEFGPVLRGQLVDRWAMLGREHTLSDIELQRETEDMERLLGDVLGKNTLPALPFIILCVLQAHQQNKINSPEEGSFGYLYEVLVTSALNKSVGAKPQLDKKYTFLSRLAYRMFKEGHSAKPIAEVRALAEEYSRSHMVSVDIPAMLSDLEYAHVLSNTEGNYSFSYPHLYHYFVARYYKDNMQGPTGNALIDELRVMIDMISSDRNYTVLIFVVYFIRDSKEVIDRLVQNADQVFQEIDPTQLSDDVGAIAQLSENGDSVLKTEYDVKRNRQNRRELMEKIETDERAADQQRPEDSAISYSDSLSDAQKFELAQRYINLFGHLIRNSPGHLPGGEKVRVLTTTYKLGLRSIKAILQMLNQSAQLFEEAISEAIKENQIKGSFEKLEPLVREMIGILARIVTLGTIKHVSLAVGVSDLEKAYAATLDKLGKTNATQLIDLSIRLDHFGEIPVSTIEELHKQFGRTAFADVVLMDMIAYHFSMFDVDRQIMQKVVSIFRTDHGGHTLDAAKLLQVRNKK